MHLIARHRPRLPADVVQAPGYTAPQQDYEHRGCTIRLYQAQHTMHPPTGQGDIVRRWTADVITPSGRCVCRIQARPGYIGRADALVKARVWIDMQGPLQPAWGGRHGD